MLEIRLKETEFWNADIDEFQYTDPQIIKLEHSLISVSKWEAIWKKPYFPSSLEPGIYGVKEELSYIECMIIGPVRALVAASLLSNHAQELHEYINGEMTASKVTPKVASENPYRRKPTVTSELIYYWMIRYNIPFECERWHLSRLLALISICNAKDPDNKDNKMSAAEAAKYRRDLNAKRLAAAGQ